MGNKHARKVCLDASLITKILVKEKDTPIALSVLEEILQQKIQIIEPNFSKVEIFSVLRKKLALRKITLLQSKKSINIFNRLISGYVIEEQVLLNRSFLLAKKLNEMTIYDCIYLQLAKENSAIFVTADKKFLKKAKTVYKNSYSPKELLNMLK